MKKRRHYMVDKRFQIRFIGVVVFSMFLFLLMVGWTVYSNIWAVLLRDTQNPYFLMVKKHADTDIFFKLTLLMIVVAIVSFFISHKFAGPVYRIRKASKLVADGDLSLRVNLRRGDEFIDLVHDFNDMVKDLRELVTKDKEKIKLISSKMKEISKDFRKKDLSAEEKDKISVQLVSLIKELGEINSEFKL